MTIGLSAPLMSYWDWHHPKNLVFVGKQDNFLSYGTFSLQNCCIVAPWKANADKVSQIKL